eukprot:1073468_1
MHHTVLPTSTHMYPATGATGEEFEMYVEMILMKKNMPKHWLYLMKFCERYLGRTYARKDVTQCCPTRAHTIHRNACPFGNTSGGCDLRYEQGLDPFDGDRLQWIGSLRRHKENHTSAMFLYGYDIHGREPICW